MALNGIRDISILETPPENRQPIKTYVLPFSSELLKEAIIRELEREGQVYYLHNNINTINFAAKNLQNLIPEARIGVTHGRIARGELNNLMRDFLENKLDILVTTTIIESGIDISNVNTIIVENAHRFGLSQLYQLKGRVGRSERQAHAYLFYPKGTELTENAYERLKTLKEHTELGSGFKIAMKDLEIRGSGNVFGGEQHGFMDEVGFEMYCRILKEVVGEEKGEIYEEWREIRFNIPINAYIPDYFVSSRDNKIEIYRNISLCSSYEEINSVTAELKENYGRIPEEVLNLLKIQKLKIAGRKVGLKEICEYDNNNIILKFYELHFSATGLNDFLAKFENNLNLKLNISDSVVIKKERGGVNFIFEQVEKILQYMKFCVNMRN
jgi:transcription-repair coupling factor (superfamily II helicase)